MTIGSYWLFLTVLGFKVDGIICHCFFDFYGISLSPSERSFYALSLMKKFEQMKFPEPFTSSDFAEERDPKKMSRILSWLFQFFETFAPANEYAYSVWNSYKEKASLASSLKQKIDSLRIINKAEEEKRLEYQNNIVELQSSLSAKLTSKRQLDERVSSESRKLALLTESEKSHSLEVTVVNFFFIATALDKKLYELKAKRESLLPQVIENPGVLPKAVEELKAKLNALELEMQEIRAKTFQVDQSISEFKRLHDVIENQLVTVARTCHSLLFQMSQSQRDLEIYDKEIAGRFASIELLGKKITDATEQLCVSEHNIVKAKVMDATRAVNDERIKKERAALLDKYCFAFKSLEPDVTAKEALLKTTKILFEREYSNKKVS
ncbi:unnamed protein product [Hydatigera taeniaeformis]|uniref:Uncharacterized protein n=1 Tax=Hydatigena taeniaeformis TaxID=6205 RepID=A0A3P7F408_HYDTA|nr:unnamed protein product [Hydatigera taeniaeformis]